MWLGGHALFNYLAVSLLSKEREEALAAVVGGVIPDISYIHYYAVPGQPIAAQRPWWTHSLAMAPLWGAISSLLATRGLKHWFAGTIGVVLHLVVDTFVYVHFGVRWLGPFMNKPIGHKLYTSGSISAEAIALAPMLVGLAILRRIRRRS